MSHIYDMIVIGGGPAGIMAALTAADYGKNILILVSDFCICGFHISSSSGNSFFLFYHRNNLYSISLTMEKSLKEEYVKSFPGVE